jgi:hypothetical protein
VSDIFYFLRTSTNGEKRIREVEQTIRMDKIIG